MYKLFYKCLGDSTHNFTYHTTYVPSVGNLFTHPDDKIDVKPVYRIVSICHCMEYTDTDADDLESFHIEFVPNYNPTPAEIG